MNQSPHASIRLLIDAPIQQVWDALTIPNIIKTYFFGTNVDTDWKVGSTIVFTGEWEGRSYIDKGTILQSNPPFLFKYDYLSLWSNKPDSPEHYNTITYLLTEQNGATELNITQTNCADEAERQHSEQNWILVMNQLKQIVEHHGTKNLE